MDRGPRERLDGANAQREFAHRLARLSDKTDDAYRVARMGTILTRNHTLASFSRLGQQCLNRSESACRTIASIVNEVMATQSGLTAEFLDTCMGRIQQAMKVILKDRERIAGAGVPVGYERVHLAAVAIFDAMLGGSVAAFRQIDARMSSASGVVNTDANRRFVVDLNFQRELDAFVRECQQHRAKACFVVLAPSTVTATRGK